MNTIVEVKSEKLSVTKIISASFLIAGTMIGAGMLAIPMATAKLGFILASFVTCGVWLFMLMTGFLLMEVVLKLPKGSNFASISEHYLGKIGKYSIGGIFLFLYICLQVAYISGGVPLFYEVLFNVKVTSWMSYFTFSAVFAFIIFLGINWINRINVILSLFMFLLFSVVLVLGMSEVNLENFKHFNFTKTLSPVPVLFSAFGYHNVVPSISDYLNKDRRAISSALFFGSLISLVVYLLWQQMVLGSVSIESLNKAMISGKTCIFALQEITSKNLYLFGKLFALIALMTSFLGVSLSVVDFLQDSFSKIKIKRYLIILMVFLPSSILACLNPAIFAKSLGVAGGIGEALLNGIFPISIVLCGHYWLNNFNAAQKYYLKKKYLFCLLTLGLLAMGIEVYELIFK